MLINVDPMKARSWTKTAWARLWAALNSRRAIGHALAIAITLYGGLLRLDAFVGKYGTLDRPAWARIATEDVAPFAASIRPSSVVWTREPTPYVGGDPINYIEYGRAMTSFYQPHVREPVFLALTHAGLWALDDQDYGVSLASLVGSTLAIFATYLVGAALLSPLTGLLAALLTAIEFEMIAWAPDGWRDDTFTATILFAGWALLKLRARPSFGNALLAGGLCALSCLTRITAISFIAPALLWIIVERAAASRVERAKAVATATLILTIGVAPFLISCAIATGDPLYAINYHTTIYRFAENQPIDKPMSAAEYLRGKFVNRPIRTFDTGFNGLFVQPFVTKWRGFEPWVEGFGRSVRAISVVGLTALPFLAAGRVLLVILLGSLLPYILTWNVGGGSEWRLTMHAYPFFLVAAAAAAVLAYRAVRVIAGTRAVPGRTTVVSVAWRISAATAGALLGVALYLGLPWYVTREAIASGDSTSIETGDRDRVFYRQGWSAPHLESITVRVSRDGRAVVRLPLPEKRAYDIVLRIDPVVPAEPAKVDVLFNRALVGRLQLSFNPERVGSYRLRLREDIVNAGSNELILIPTPIVPAGSAGPRFAWLDPTDRIGVRLWYVRILP
jgi:4-amino-4-deoxy-L-arabinose transferase-like glycosyltransferase